MFLCCFVCFVFLFENYVKDEPPKESILWKVQRDTDIKRNLATVKFKLRLWRWFFPLSEGFSKPKGRKLITGIAETRKDLKTFEKLTARMLLLFHQIGETEKKFHVAELF